MRTFLKEQTNYEGSNDFVWYRGHAKNNKRG